MKTGDLIKHLQRADPSGEREIGVRHFGDAFDIHFIMESEYYWDGYLQVVNYEKGSPKSARYQHEGNKLTIELLSISDILIDSPDFPVEPCCDRHDKRVENWREYSRLLDSKDDDALDAFEAKMGKGDDREWWR